MFEYDSPVHSAHYFDIDMNRADDHSACTSENDLVYSKPGEMTQSVVESGDHSDYTPVPTNLIKKK